MTHELAQANIAFEKLENLMISLNRDNDKEQTLYFKLLAYKAIDQLIMCLQQL